MSSKKDQRRLKIKKRIRGVISGSAARPRLAVFRSNNEIYAQIVNDEIGHTLSNASSSELKSKGSKVEASKEVGKLVAEKALANGISEVVFDRGGYLYHGRVKALAEGAREAGLKF